MELIVLSWRFCCGEEGRQLLYIEYFTEIVYDYEMKVDSFWLQ